MRERELAFVRAVGSPGVLCEVGVIGLPLPLGKPRLGARKEVAEGSEAGQGDWPGTRVQACWLAPLTRAPTAALPPGAGRRRLPGHGRKWGAQMPPPTGGTACGFFKGVDSTFVWQREWTR